MLMSWAHIRVRLSSSIFPKSLWLEKAQSLFLPILLRVSQRAHTRFFIHDNNIHIFQQRWLCQSYGAITVIHVLGQAFVIITASKSALPPFYYLYATCHAKCVICITLWNVSSPAPCKTMRMQNFGADCWGSQNIIYPRCACTYAFDVACTLSTFYTLLPERIWEIHSCEIPECNAALFEHIF